MGPNIQEGLLACPNTARPPCFKARIHLYMDFQEPRARTVASGDQEDKLIERLWSLTGNGPWIHSWATVGDKFL